MERIEADLKRWSLKIDQLVARTQLRGAHPSFDALTYIDELKALHAIALSELESFKAGEGKERPRPKARMKRAWKEADAAFKRPRP